MRATIAGLAALTCVASLVACGTSSREKNARRPAQLVADSVAQLQRDLAAKDYEDVCMQVFSSAARTQAGGPDCPRFVARGAAGLRDPRIELGEIDVHGGSATAAVVTRAAGQAAAPEKIRLVWENGRFRIAALAG
jgi:hypothetical protein